MLETIVFKYKKQINGLVHVGAGIGQEVHIYKENNVKNLHLFEPQKQAFEELNKYKNQNIKTYDFGLGNQDMEIELYVTNNNYGAASSILKPTQQKKYFPEIKFETKEKIRIKKFSQLEIFNTNFLVMDVQGFELEVMKGCEDKLNNFDFIFTEVSRKEFYENNVLISEIDNYLSKYNFVRTNVFWISNKPQGDALYVKKEKLNKFQILFSIFNSKLQTSNFYILISFIRNRKKMVYTLKSVLKKYLKL